MGKGNHGKSHSNNGHGELIKKLKKSQRAYACGAMNIVMGFHETEQQCFQEAWNAEGEVSTWNRLQTLLNEHALKSIDREVRELRAMDESFSRLQREDHETLSESVPLDGRLRKLNSSVIRNGPQ